MPETTTKINPGRLPPGEMGPDASVTTDPQATTLVLAKLIDKLHQIGMNSHLPAGARHKPVA
jgi:hypothetical protein